MADITLVKRAPVELTDQQRAALRAFLFECLGGLTDHDRRRWAWMWRHVQKMEQGETFLIRTRFTRSTPFHRFHMALEGAVFDAQERIPTIEQFRLWLKIGAGFVDWMPGPKGGVVPVPKSIAYTECDEQTMRDFHQDCLAFLRTESACRYLWPALPAQQAGQAMDNLLSRFDR